MNRIGYVLHVSNTRNLILKAENIPRIGDHVINEKLKSAGIVFDVFGPTSSPYVAIKTNTQNPEQFVNQILYTNSSRNRTKKKRKR